MKMQRGHWNTLIKVTIVIAFLAICSGRIDSQDDLQGLWSLAVAQWQSSAKWYLIVAMCLMPLNWSLEVVKWRLLMKSALVVSWKRAAAAVMSGIVFSLFTPNRIGEYAGRVLHVPSAHMWHAVVTSITGSFAQNLIHLSVGLLAVVFMIGHAVQLPGGVEKSLWLVASVVTILLWVVYFRLPGLATLLTRWRGPRFMEKAWHALDVIRGTPQKVFRITISLALCRYLVFSGQYVLLLYFFKADISWIPLFAGVAVIYLMHTSIPLPPVADVVARNELGIFLWAGAGMSEQTILAAGFSIWILNLALPALFGVLALTTVNVLRNLTNERDSLPLTVPVPDRTLDRNS